MSILQNLGVRTAQNGKSFASGVLAADSGHDVEVTTGLATVDHCGASLAAAPTILHTIAAATTGTLAGDINVLGFRPTTADDTTPIASTTEVAVTWWAIGDR
jgi:hypothetical protein